MKKKLLSLAIALTLCLGLTVPALAKDLKDATKQDILNTFTIYRNGTIDETKGDYLVDTTAKLHYAGEETFYEENYHVISGSDSFTITNTGSKEISASGNTDYDITIWLNIYAHDKSSTDHYMDAYYHYVWGTDGRFIYSEDQLMAWEEGIDVALHLKAGESTTIPASALVDDLLGPDCIFKLSIDVNYEGYTWDDYGANIAIMDAMDCGRFNFLIDETRKAQIDASMAEPTEPTTPAVTFTDVNEGDWYAPAVAWAAGLGYVNGVGGNRFAPLSDCTHAQILTMLYRADRGGDVAASADDMDKAVSWAREKGMIDDSFDPDDACTRASALKYIWEALGRQSGAASSFDDVSPDADYAAAVDWAVELGITEGTGNNQFTPDKVCNRGTIATFLHRAYVPEVRLTTKG